MKNPPEIRLAAQGPVCGDVLSHADLQARSDAEAARFAQR